MKKTVKNSQILIKMKRIRIVSSLILAILLVTGCSPLGKMIDLAKEKQNTEVTPDPLEVHAGEVGFEVAVTVPQGMLKKGTLYNAELYYKYDDKEETVGSIEFDSDNYPDNATSPTKLSGKFSFPYKEVMNPGELAISGTAKLKSSGKTASFDEKIPVAKGIITTSQLVEDVYYVSYADHGYNDSEELIPTIVDFFFDKGSPVLKYSERNGERGKKLSAFIAEKNVTRTVTITGAHSPEGLETVNTKLASKRAEAIEAFYRKQMKKYDYKGAADSIKFILKPVVRDWTAFKSALQAFDDLDASAKSEILKIVNGSGTFEDKEKQLQKLSSYKVLAKKIYPPLRTAKTEVLTVKPKKANSEIAVLAKQIVAGEANADTLSIEEFLFAASLTPDLGEKEKIYASATKKTESWVAHNNLGAVYLSQAIEGGAKAKLVEKAIAQLEIAAKMRNSATVLANLGTAYTLQENYEQAYEALANGLKASPSSTDAKGIKSVKGAIEIRNASYEDAVASLSGAQEEALVVFDRGLALLLNKEYQNAKTSFQNAADLDGDLAIAYYGAAVASARLKEENDVINYLKKAIEKDMSLKNKAIKDLEFQNFALSSVLK